MIATTTSVKTMLPVLTWCRHMNAAAPQDLWVNSSSSLINVSTGVGCHMTKPFPFFCLKLLMFLSYLYPLIPCSCTYIFPHLVFPPGPCSPHQGFIRYCNCCWPWVKHVHTAVSFTSQTFLVVFPPSDLTQYPGFIFDPSLFVSSYTIETSFLLLVIVQVYLSQSISEFLLGMSIQAGTVFCINLCM